MMHDCFCRILSLEPPSLSQVQEVLCLICQGALYTFNSHSLSIQDRLAEISCQGQGSTSLAPLTLSGLAIPVPRNSNFDHTLITHARLSVS